MLTIDDVVIFADGLDHPECVAVHPDGSVWAGGEAGQVYRISRDGLVIEEVTNTKGFNLGIAFSPDASWLAICDLKNKCVWKYHLQTNVLSVFAEGADRHLFNIPNYASFSKNGHLFISDSGAFIKNIGKRFKKAPQHGVQKSTLSPWELKM